jgi:hypothetical protein
MLQTPHSDIMYRASYVAQASPALSVVVAVVVVVVVLCSRQPIATFPS